VCDEGGELASLVETGAQETGDLLDEGLRGKERIVLLGWIKKKEGGGLRLVTAAAATASLPKFLMIFLFLFHFFMSSTVTQSRPASLDWSAW